MPMTIEHILPEALGGATVEDNLWLSCIRCNLFKRTQTHAVDPDTRERVPLFDPRRDAERALRVGRRRRRDPGDDEPRSGHGEGAPPEQRGHRDRAAFPGWRRVAAAAELNAGAATRRWSGGHGATPSAGPRTPRAARDRDPRHRPDRSLGQISELEMKRGTKPHKDPREHVMDELDALRLRVLPKPEGHDGCRATLPTPCGCRKILERLHEEMANLAWVAGRVTSQAALSSVGCDTRATRRAPTGSLGSTRRTSDSGRASTCPAYPWSSRVSQRERSSSAASSNSLRAFCRKQDGIEVRGAHANSAVRVPASRWTAAAPGSCAGSYQSPGGVLPPALGRLPWRLAWKRSPSAHLHCRQQAEFGCSLRPAIDH